MSLKTYGLMALLLCSGSGFADQLALEDAAKQLMKDSAQSAVPAEAAETLDSANRSVEKAKNLKESMERAPASLQEQPAGAAGQARGAKPAGTTQEMTPPEPPKTTGPAKATDKPRQGKRQPR